MVKKMAYRFTNKTTEKCPKCGADVEGNVKYCPFCGNIVSKEAFEDTSWKIDYDFQDSEKQMTDAEDIRIDATEPLQDFTVQYSDEYTSNPKKETSRLQREITSVRKVDIISKANPLEQNIGYKIFFLIFWIIIGVAVTSGFASMAGPLCILPLGLLTYGIIRIAKEIGEGTRYKATKRNAPEYEAVVIDHNMSQIMEGTKETRRIINVGKVKVVADIDGEDLCIIITTGERDAKLLYPVGSTVTICGSGNYWLLKE